MSKLNQFSLMIDALAELAEEEQAHHTPPAPGLPNLRSVIANASPCPRKRYSSASQKMDCPCY
ncbi:hypothetical protein [Candidatus Villigracilis saccharophilus]|uniref:hypothetical protein n=1 Tax=Candidatus Villigracilis saccharophilus TaxID=3140684 RepID=UPI003134D37E|nr:hypothetical protein [Anaerolineales bacterium]